MLGGNAIPTVLVGATNIGVCFRRIETFVTSTNSEWRKYYLTDDFAEARATVSLPGGKISYLNGVLDQALFLLITNSVKDNIKTKKIQSFYDKDGTVIPRDVLVYLRECCSEIQMRGYAEVVGDYKSVQNISIDKQFKWVQQCATYMLKYAESNEKMTRIFHQKTK